ncbi:hypothetical protein F4825DRAFT_416528 [Nemania diffusa]|nr:hypothetical protein F4825DRAFT_416528 [Nemania diffusa]
MSCACRTKSLRIFVQSLTELRVTTPILPRFLQLHRLDPLVTLHQAPARYPTRLYSSASAAYSSGQKLRDHADDSSAYKAEKEPPHKFIDTGAGTKTHDSLTSTPFASTNDLAAAKQSGTILEFNAESIDTLVASLNQTPIAEKKPRWRNIGKASSDAQIQARSKPKPPSISSQLKRSKIMKEEVQPKPMANKEQLTHREMWQIQKQVLKEKFPEGWRPRKRLSPDALEGIRALHTQFPEQYTTESLSKTFEVSPEAIRRILRSKWSPTADEEMEREERWFNRGKNIWSQMAALGKKPPRRWRREGIVREPHWNKKKGPRTEYPYVPLRDEPDNDEPSVESAQRRLSGRLL